MNMKKMLALLLALVMVFALAACGNSGANNSDDDDNEGTTTSGTQNDPTGNNEDPTGNNNDKPTTNKTETRPIAVAPSESEPEADKPVVDEPVDRPMPGVTETPSAITEFVNGEGGQMFMEEFMVGFESSGLTCTANIEAMGTGFVITICINELDDVSEEDKAAMQASYDEMAPLMGDAMEAMKAELEGLTYFCVNVCDVDGDFLASLYVE